MRSASCKVFFLYIIAFLPFNGKGQVGLCPPNLDFEAGNFFNWVCQSGQVFAVGNQNVITWTGTGPVPGQHTIINAATAGVDPYGFFPEACPNGSGYSVKLGNNGGNHNAESISYTYAIPSTLTTFSVIFNYAVVFQDPNHFPWEQPRFRARIVDLTTGNPIPCVDFDFVATASLPGFQQSPVDPSVFYKGWTPITINLSGYIGRTIMLEFITSDCVFVAHFGYAYIDVNTQCNGAIQGSTVCAGDNQITMTAPFGFQGYEWYSDQTYTNLISTSQSVTINPAPTVGTVYPVIVIPYLGFGCRDTLFATITVTQKPVSVAGPDQTICKFTQAQIGGPATPAYQYLWSPANQVSNPLIPNPSAWTLTAGPEEFIVRTTDILSGCFSYDTMYISTRQIDTGITVSGKLGYCFGDPNPAVLSVNPNSNPVQWYDATGPIAGATGITYQPTTSGSYWVSVSQNGCTDSSAPVPILIHPLPTALFSPVSDTGCITNNSLVFTNASSTPDGSPLSYEWRFSDGTNYQTPDVTKSFTAIGTYTVEMVTTTVNGCKDSTDGLVRIMPNAEADFKWDSVCLNRPVLFTNLSTENGSTQVNYNWNFNNGGPLYSVKNPPMITFTTPGWHDVILDVVALGCENDPKSITKQVRVNDPAAGIRYNTITVPQGYTRYIHVRDSIGNVYSWRPQKQLTRYDAQYTEFNAIDDVEYLIDITDGHTCVTTDTLQMLVLKKTGYYLPSAFTPNGDNLNDVARPYLINLKSLKSFSIYDRWGQRVYYTVTDGEGWDGKHGGKDQAPGVYVWVLEFITTDNRQVMEKGLITLIR